jgi:hypothetical protein
MRGDAGVEDQDKEGKDEEGEEEESDGSCFLGALDRAIVLMLDRRLMGGEQAVALVHCIASDYVNEDVEEEAAIIINMLCDVIESVDALASEK